MRCPARIFTEGARMTLYSEWDKFAAAWLRELIADGQLPPGDVDERDIRELRAADVVRYDTCHFFAGIGGWPYALRIAGWPDDRPVWTASLPCQPFSQAGKRKGTADERHLWPVFFELVQECSPPVVIGEQVSSPDGIAWCAGIHADLEDAGYQFEAVDIPAASVGAPHIRQRLYWVAWLGNASIRRERSLNGQSSESVRLQEPHRGSGVLVPHGLEHADSSGHFSRKQTTETTGHGLPAESASSVNRLGDTAGEGLQRENGTIEPIQGSRESSILSGLGNSSGIGLQREPADTRGSDKGSGAEGSEQRPWDNFAIVPCRDPKRGIVYRRFEPGSFPLAPRLPRGVATRCRTGSLKVYGNAIVPPLAAMFIRAFMETHGCIAATATQSSPPQADKSIVATTANVNG